MNKEKSFLSLGYCEGTSVEVFYSLITFLQRGIQVLCLQTNIQVLVTKYCQFIPLALRVTQLFHLYFYSLQSNMIFLHLLLLITVMLELSVKFC